MIVYFTGTGNSRWVAEKISLIIGDEVVNSFEYIRSQKKAELHSERPFVFVCPTYGWRIPRIFQSFIENAELSGSNKAYFVMDCGGEIGNASPYIKKLCDLKKLEYMGVFEILMPENYIALFGVPEGEEAAKIISGAEPKVCECAKIISENKKFPPHNVGIADKLKSGIVNDVFYKFVISDKKFAVGDNCVSCGKCASLCPLNNIKLTDGKPKWLGNCTHCMACICSCPVRAIEYGKGSAGRPQYYNNEKVL